jgi:predicted enzyme related to lactoylglutathione lyase/DNA-binding MarR family transcriptional regulator
MATEYDDLVLPVLLAEARRAFATAIRADLSAAGFDDMPAAGARVIGRIARGGTSVSEVAMAYGVTKQAGSQLVDALVLRGYVERVPDPVDRRRMNVALTARGEEAAIVLRGAVERVEAALLEVIDGQTLVTMRAGLGVLAAIGFGESPPRPEVAAAPVAHDVPTLGNGKVCYLQIPAEDVHVSADFYARVFGWAIRRSDGALAFDDGVGEVSGTWVLGRPPSKVAGLLVYVMVDDVAATIERVLAHGGALVQPMEGEAPELTARITDPAGNVVGIAQQ